VVPVLASLGGDDAITAQERLILEDVARVGVIIRAEMARYLRTEDPGAARDAARPRRSARRAAGSVGIAFDKEHSRIRKREEPARLLRDSSIAAAVTWRVSGIGMGRITDIREAVKDRVDEFINAWLSVNPKQP